SNAQAGSSKGSARRTGMTGRGNIPPALIPRIGEAVKEHRRRAPVGEHGAPGCPQTFLGGRLPYPARLRAPPCGGPGLLLVSRVDWLAETGSRVQLRHMSIQAVDQS